MPSKTIYKVQVNRTVRSKTYHSKQAAWNDAANIRDRQIMSGKGAKSHVYVLTTTRRKR